MNDPRVLVGMSGGVDSGVCAYLLRQDGYLPVGLTLRLWSERERLRDDPCPAADENAENARRIAERLNIPHHTVALGDAFRHTVVEPFIAEYARGNTPNPCVNCNRHIKFGRLMELTDSYGCARLATGHYAKITREPSGEHLLRKAKDTKKDQSYFLWSIDRKTLPRLLLPLGDYDKNEIRAIAEKASLPCAHRSDSQDICFVPDGDYIAFIEKNSSLTFPQGHFVSLDGAVLGTHNGIIRYTVGQRKGLGIALGQPAFVCAKNAADNTVTLCSDSELYRRTLTATHLNFLVNEDFVSPRRVEARIRYRHTPAAATVTRVGEDHISICFDEPQRAVAPGQSVVLYDGDVLLGGGVIESTDPTALL